MNTNQTHVSVNRRQFIRAGSLALAALGLETSLPGKGWCAATAPLSLADLPHGSAPPPVALPHFPDRLHAFVWRNWFLVDAGRMATVVGARRSQILRLGQSMGLPTPPRIRPDQQQRSTLTVIRRNWHLLPYDQLLQLLDWTPEQMAFTLREDDFLYVKLGNLKPKCPPLKYQLPDTHARQREREIAKVIEVAFPEGPGPSPEPRFAFLNHLSQPLKASPHRPKRPSLFRPRFCYSYFAVYGDPLLEPKLDPYPDGYLARLADLGVDGVWLPAVLAGLADYPWDPSRSRQCAVRQSNLRKLAERAQRFGMGVYLYLNEPRALPTSFYAARPEIKGVVEGDYAALCTSQPAVREYLTAAIATLCQAVPDLAGFFTISGSENLTHCWSHGGGANCPRCRQRPPAEVIAELHACFHKGIRQSGGQQKLIAWDWGWADDWVDDIVARLPDDVQLMSVSEWSIPIQRGGVATTVGEYSISTIGPGPRAQRHWDLARNKGLKTMAKIQCGNSWELSAVPYVPALANVAQHLDRLRHAGINGLMLGWTLGGYPSPNLELVAELSDPTDPVSVETALRRVAERRFGSAITDAMVEAWQAYSLAFSEFPFHSGVVYNAPLQLGPANLLWGQSTGYHATMVGFPYDDLDGWRSVYPPDVFIQQMEKVAAGFEQALAALQSKFQSLRNTLPQPHQKAVLEEMDVAEAAALHFRSVANQARFVRARQQVADAKSTIEFQRARTELEALLHSELQAAQRLYAVASRDSRIGFEASNQYYYVPFDLVEKVLNCQDLLHRWLPNLTLSSNPTNRPPQ